MTFNVPLDFSNQLSIKMGEQGKEGGRRRMKYIAG
jgi:hypothetical protein